MIIQVYREEATSVNEAVYQARALRLSGILIVRIGGSGSPLKVARSLHYDMVVFTNEQLLEDQLPPCVEDVFSDF